MAKVTIVWQAFADFGHETKKHSFDYNQGELDDLDVCENVFRDTNLYTGEIWESIKDELPTDRSHTALSVGDIVSIDSRAYLCDVVGFSKL